MSWLVKVWWLLFRLMHGEFRVLFWAGYSRQVYGYGCLYKLWQMRTGLSVKQCSVEKWKTCMGFKLYALYGMYLLLPGRSNRIWKEKRRKTTIYFWKNFWLIFYNLLFIGLILMLYELYDKIYIDRILSILNKNM